MKQIGCLILLVFVVILQGCGANSVVFPEDDYSPPASAVVTGGVPSNIDFYIQGTVFMDGFRTDTTYKKTPELLYDTAQALWPKAGMRYYRFDYVNMTGRSSEMDPDKFRERFGTDSEFAYEIEQNDFVNSAITQDGFYSFAWMTTKSNNHPAAYVTALEQIEREKKHFDMNYMTKTIKQLDKSRFSVMITDLVDSGFDDTQALTAALRDYIESDGDDTQRSVSIIKIVADFYGDIYLPLHVITGDMVKKNDEAPLKNAARFYNGPRPYYILLFGDKQTNTDYCRALKAALPADKDICYLLMADVVNVVSSGTVSEADGSMSGVVNALITNENRTELMNLQALQNPFLYYYITDASDTGELTIEIPLSDNGIDEVSNAIVTDIRVYGIEEGELNHYQEITKNLSEIVTYETKSADQLISTKLTISKAGVERYAYSVSVPKMRLIIEQRVDLSQTGALAAVNEATKRRDDAPLEEDDMIKYYGSGTVSLESVTKEMWNVYKQHTDTRVGYTILYIRAGR